MSKINVTARHISIAPIMFSMPGNGTARVNYAAFRVSCRIELDKAFISAFMEKFDKSKPEQPVPDTIEGSVDLIEGMQYFLRAIQNASPFKDDDSGYQQLLALGIPSAYADSYQALHRFLDLDHADLYNAWVKSGMLTYGSVGTATYRFPESAYNRREEGNYREIEAKCRWPADDQGSLMIGSILNEQKGNMNIVADMFPPGFDKSPRALLSHGFLEIEFTLIDRRQINRESTEG